MVASDKQTAQWAFVAQQPVAAGWAHRRFLSNALSDSDSHCQIYSWCILLTILLIDIVDYRMRISIRGILGRLDRTVQTGNRLTKNEGD